MSKLNEEELLDVFDGVFSFYLGELGHEEDKPRIKQARQQIKEMIQKPIELPQKRGLDIEEIIAKYPRVARDKMRELVAKIDELQKPGVTEEWIEEKAEQIHLYVLAGQFHNEEIRKDFIRKIVEEIK